MLKLYSILKLIYDKIVETYNLISQITENIYYFTVRLKNIFPTLIKEIWNITYSNPDYPEIPNTQSRIDFLEQKSNDNQKILDELNLRIQLRRVGTGQELVLKNMYSDNEDCVKVMQSKLGSIIYLLKQNIPIPIYTTAYIANPSAGNIQLLDSVLDTGSFFGLISYSGATPPHNVSFNPSSEPPLFETNGFSNIYFYGLNHFKNPYSSSSNLKLLSFGCKLYMYYNSESETFKLNADSYLPLLFITENSKRWSSFNFIFVISFKKYIPPEQGQIYDSIIFRIHPFICFLKYNNFIKMYEIKTNLDPNFNAGPNGLINIAPPINITITNQENYYQTYKINYNWGNLPNITNLNYPNDCEYIGIGLSASWGVGESRKIGGEHYNLYHFNFPVIQLIGNYNLTHFWACESVVELKSSECPPT